MNQKLDRNIIEYLLASLDSSLRGDADIDRLLGAYQNSEWQMLIEAYRIRTAHLLGEFANAMPGGFFIYRANGNEEIIYVNDAILSIFGCENKEEFRILTGNSFRGIVHPDDLEQVEESIEHQISKNEDDLDYVEYRIIRKDGEVRWIEDYGYLVHSDVAGDVFYVFVRDSTEKRRRQQAEREKKRAQEQKLRDQIEVYNKELEVVTQENVWRYELIEGLSVDYESIFYADLDENWIRAYRVSERFQDQFSKDCPVREFAGFDDKYIANWVFPADRKIVAGISDPSYIREKLSHQKTFHVTYRIFRNGVPEYIQLRIVNAGRDGRVSQIVLGYRNVDEEMSQEFRQRQMLAEALEEANRANRAKNLFLSNMSHDIRTPMNAIMGYTSLVKKHLDDTEKVMDYLDMISNASDQLMQLLNDVLEISRIESGKIQVEKEECNLVDLVRRIEAVMLSKVKEKKITFTVDLSRIKHNVVYVEQQKLGMILSHIMSNAIQYTDRGGAVSMAVVEEKVHNHHAVYHFVIKDNGIGISEEFLAQIFEPFVREKNTTMSGIYGTGLGLTITKGLVDSMGGTIDIASEVGKGSTFTTTFALRIQEQKQMSVSELDIIELDRNLKPKRILIVDDNEINMEIESEVLKEGGFLVDTAADGSIAVEKVKNSLPGYYDLILMDIQMPVMNGYCATKAIRQLEDPALANIPIIAVSVNAFEEDRKMSLKCGMNDHLPKPVDAVGLLRVICKFIQHREAESTHADLLL